MVKTRHQETNKFGCKVSVMDRGAGEGKGRKGEDNERGGGVGGSHQKTPAGLINPTSDCVHILKCPAD